MDSTTEKAALVARLRSARADGERPSARGADLRYADLRYADLRGADLRDANLRGADLRDADLRYADLRDADLRYADLRYADLRYADLRYADLRISGSGLLSLTGLPSGTAILVPTCDGWKLRVGCWTGTPDKLRALIARDEGWPEAEGDEIIARRPGLALLADLCDAHTACYPDLIDRLAAKWGDKTDTEPTTEVPF